MRVVCGMCCNLHVVQMDIRFSCTFLTKEKLHAVDLFLFVLNIQYRFTLRVSLLQAVYFALE